MVERDWVLDLEHCLNNQHGTWWRLRALRAIAEYHSGPPQWAQIRTIEQAPDNGRMLQIVKRRETDKQ